MPLKLKTHSQRTCKIVSQRTCDLCTAGRFFTVWARLSHQGSPSQRTVSILLCLLVAQLYLTLCDPMDCSPPGSSVHGILQARILECVAIPFTRGSSWPRDWTLVSCIAGRFFTIWATREAHIYPKKQKDFFKSLNICLVKTLTCEER